MPSTRGKRKIGTPTGYTPGKPAQKKITESESTSRKSLFNDATDTELDGQSSKNLVWREWTKKEIKGLIQYVALHNDGSGSWPRQKCESYWGPCGMAVAEYSGMPSRSGNACRLRMLKIKKLHETVDDAEEAFNIDYFGDVEDDNIQELPNDVPIRGDILTEVTENLSRLSLHQRVQLVTKVFMSVAVNDFKAELKHFIPPDFVKLCLSAMAHLLENGKDNVISDLCKSLGEMKKDGSSARLDVNKMPFGLIAYNCKFFAVDDASNLCASKDYMQWMQSMYTYFGNTWASLHLGPMWSYNDENQEEEEKEKKVVDIIGEALAMALEGKLVLPESPPQLQAKAALQVKVVSPKSPEVEAVSSNPSHNHPSTLWTSLSPSEREEVSEAEVDPKEIGAMFGLQVQTKKTQRRKRKTMDAKVNVAGPNARTVRRHIADSGFRNDTGVQVDALKKLKEANPEGRWFIKADATDMKMGLRESMRGEWTGDSDLGDGELQEAKRKYDERLLWIKGLGLKERCDSERVAEDLKELANQLNEELEFLTTGKNKAEASYEAKRKQKNVAEQTLFALAWTVEGFEKLLEMNEKLVGDISDLVDLNEKGVVGVNFPRKLAQLRNELRDYVKGVSSKQRDAASHLMVFMVSEEERKRKPYAIPVRVLPYKSIKDDGLRKLRDEIRTVMNEIGMVSVGFSTDGEFNSLRTMGGKRPISVIQLMMDAKGKARSVSAREIERCLRPVRGNDGNIYPLKAHDAIPLEDVRWLYQFMQDGVRFDDAIYILRRKHFPLFYDPRPWVPGKDESKSDCLKSLMAQYLYRKSVLDYAAAGVDFRNNLYVPEVDEKTGEEFHEREDHNHVLKRITTCTRGGTVPDVDLQAFVKCLNDPDSGLTYTALTGQHKQSVPDCERMFSRGVLEFMEKNGYENEARFVKLVHNWHKASDGRGLTEETRSQYNKAMLDYLLEDWMQWYWYMRDYSTMDVNRPIKGIKGLTREVVVALVANIESQEQRRLDYSARELPPEHPRGSATDDLEGFFSTLHLLLGLIFDHKTFLDNYRKIEQEFVKRGDPELPFNYWTGVNERFNVGPLASFNEPSDGKPERLDQVRISRRADPGVFVANRASIPQKNTTTVRAQFHAEPERLPPRVLHI